MKRMLYTLLATVALMSCNRSLSFTVDSGDWDREDCVIQFPLDSKGTYTALVETTDGTMTEIPCQTVGDQGGRTLCFILSGKTPAHTVRSFKAVAGPKDAAPKMTAEDDGNSINLRACGKDVLSYRYTVHHSPEGVRAVYDRSGFIHPVKTPSGFVITGIQPVDHRHHFGVWNPWTRLEYNGKVYDLWNLGDSLGTVRARSVDALCDGDVTSGFDASLDHFIFSPEGEKKVLDENLEVRAFDTGDGYLWDFVSTIRPCAELPVTFKAYRYQGICVRGTELWGGDNVEMMTSEGKERPEIDSSRADWVYLNGTVGGKVAGFLMMSDSSNHDSPASLRIWDAASNRGVNNVFVNYCPAKFSDWQLPEEGATLRYRLFVYDGAMTPERAAKLWRDYSNPPVVTLIR